MQTTTIREDKSSAIISMAKRLGCDADKLTQTLKKTVFKIKEREATNEELMALVIVANEYELNPFTKEIIAFPAKTGGIVPVVSVDGWNRRVNSHPQFDGVKFEFEKGEDGKPISCTCTMYRKDRKYPIQVTEYYSECARLYSSDKAEKTEFVNPWQKWPFRMLRHKAFIQCARIAFGFSGITDEEEAREIVIESPAGTSRRNYKITSPKFEELQEKKVELFAAEKQQVTETELELIGGNK